MPRKPTPPGPDALPRGRPRKTERSRVSVPYSDDLTAIQQHLERGDPLRRAVTLARAAAWAIEETAKRLAEGGET
jgi:hypothetical protein